MIGLLLILALSGCASTKLVSSEKTAEIPTRQHRTLLVVGLSETPETRQVFEQIFSDELKKRHINAVSSYTIEGLRGKTTPTREAFVEALKTAGADGLLSTRFVHVKNKKDTKSGFVMTGRGTDIGDYCGGYWGGVEHYATFESKSVNEIVSSVTTLESVLFDAGTGKVLWKGVSNETRADKLIQSTRELAGLVLNALSKEGLLTGK
jgi:hypothetical protein